nr:hypothetical protein [Methanothermus fervidus]
MELDMLSVKDLIAYTLFSLLALSISLFINCTNKITTNRNKSEVMIISNAK